MPDDKRPSWVPYSELPLTSVGTRRAWSELPPPDSRTPGRLGLITRETVQRAAALVRDGGVFALDAPLTLIDPPLAGRKSYLRRAFAMPGGIFLDDVLDNFYPQAGSQWDALNHVSAPDGQFLGGFGLHEVLGGAGSGIDVVASRGVAGRGVLLDLSALCPAPATESSAKRPITAADLERARRDAGVDWEPGDLLLVYTGWLDWYRTLTSGQRRSLTDGTVWYWSGLAQTESVAAYLWDSGIAAVVSDNPSLNDYPTVFDVDADPFSSLHRILIGELGIALGELWDLGELASACRRDGRFTFLLASAPLHIPNGHGSTANALALR